MNQVGKSEFGELLVSLIKEANMSQRTFYEELGITKPYFYDILSGRACPPPNDMQFKMVEILKPDFNESKQFFELAGKYRNSIPADIAIFLTEDERNNIRNKNSFKKVLGGIINGKKRN
ncbi:MAG: helix-turn-helix transcriptional regulator [Clostridia bacterium]|nr:helix-turn-helix transcriptional regulator [Clostridia bacterium]